MFWAPYEPGGYGPAPPRKASVNEAEMSADKEEEQEEEGEGEEVYCERGEVSREPFQLMNIHQSNRNRSSSRTTPEVLLSGRHQRG